MLDYFKQYMHMVVQKVHHYNFSIPDNVWDTSYTVELAKNKMDLEAVFKLQHESYVARGLMKPHPSGLRCTIHHFLPQTHHVVVKYNGMVVASVTLIGDSSLGLPADRFFEDELNELRAQEEKLVELSAFVVDKGFKSATQSLMHLLMKYAYNYVQKHMEHSQIIMTVHPSKLGYYTRNWFFQRRSDVIKFHSSKNAYTTLVTHPLSAEYRNFFMKSFSSTEIYKNTAAFISNEDDRFKYPYRKEGQVLHPVMTPDLLEYFFLQQTNLYEDLDSNSRQVFLEMYLQFFGEAEIERFLNLERELTLKEFRIPVSARVAIKAGPQLFIGKIRDITTTGCFVELPQELKNSSSEIISLSFKIGDTQLQVKGRTSWRNMQKQLRYGHGYGIQFENPISEVKSEIKNWFPDRGRRIAA